MSGRLKTWMVGLVGFLALAVVTFVFLQSSSRDPSMITMPKPNGYDDFLEAARRAAVDNQVSEIVEPKEIEAFLAANQESIELLKEGLTKESQVPLRYDETYLSSHMKEVGLLKAAHWSLILEGRLLERQGQFGRASESYLAVVQYAHSISKGGLIIDALVGLAVEGHAVKSLEALVADLDAEASKNALRRLSQFDQGGSFDPSAIIERERRFFRNKARGFKRLIVRFEFLVTSKPLKAVYNNFRGTVNKGLAHRRRLMVALEARIFELEKGDPAQGH